jgi:hypothetical protein
LLISQLGAATFLTPLIVILAHPLSNRPAWIAGTGKER